MGIKFLPFLRTLERRRSLAAAGLFGALSALALPPFYLLPALPVALCGLIALLDGANAKQAFWRGFCFAFAHHLIGLYWITEAILFEAARYWWLVPIAVPTLALALAGFIAAPCWLAVRIPPGAARVLALCGLWTLGGLAQQFVLTGFPWNPLGSVWALPGAFGDLALQPAAIVSVHGLTLATLLLSATPALGARAMLGALVAMTICGLWSAQRLAQPAPRSPNVMVALIQANILQGQKSDPSAFLEMFQSHLKLTETAVNSVRAGVQTVVVWPETASPYLLQRDENARLAIASAANGPALIGGVLYDGVTAPRNGLIALAPSGDIVGAYEKHHLVPFGEYIPNFVPLPVKILPGAPFARGSGPKTLHIDKIPSFAPQICYEDIFPGAIVDERDRPAWMVNVTNDSWFGNSSGPRQHLAAVRLRAVEEGLPIMRAANTGISAGFDAFGRELGRLDMGVKGVLTLDLPGPLPPTLFSRYGLAIPFFCAILCLIMALALAKIRSRTIAWDAI